MKDQSIISQSLKYFQKAVSTSSTAGGRNQGNKDESFCEEYSTLNNNEAVTLN